jgi:plastocyanin
MNSTRFVLDVGLVAMLAFLAQCGAAQSAPKPTAAVPPASPASGTPAAKPAPAAAATPKNDPVSQRAAALREAAGLLERAAAALADGNRNSAEQLFSSAEMLVGADAVAELAGTFRAGAPPRITTPTIRFDPATAPQPERVGSSEQEDEEDKVAPPRVEGSLSGTIQVAGTPAGGVGLVTLTPVGPKGRPRHPRRRVIEQRGRVFAPRLTAISVGSTIAFPNFDTVFHNVFSTSPAAPFDLGLYRSGEAREYTFTKEGVLRLGCNLHASMSAYVAVVAAPHYIVTDGSGHFEFHHLAPGKYKLSAWNERSKEPVVKDVTIKAGKNSFDVPVSDDAPQGPPPDKFGGKRG